MSAKAQELPIRVGGRLDRSWLATIALAVAAAAVVLALLLLVRSGPTVGNTPATDAGRAHVTVGGDGPLQYKVLP